MSEYWCGETYRREVLFRILYDEPPVLYRRGDEHQVVPEGGREGVRIRTESSWIVANVPEDLPNTVAHGPVRVADDPELVPGIQIELVMDRYLEVAPSMSALVVCGTGRHRLGVVADLVPVTTPF